MRERRRRGSHRLVEQDLLVRVREMILTTNDLRDPHVDVVADDAQVVKWASVRTQEREVFDVGVLPLLNAVHAVFEASDALVRNFEANRERRALGTSRGLRRGE